MFQRALSLMGLLVVLLACKFLPGGGKSYPDSSDGLKQLAADLTVASDSQGAKMGTNLALPDASAFFTKTFGAEMGAKLAGDYATEAPKLASIQSFFKMATVRGRTVLLVDKHTDATDENANMLQQTAMKAMVAPVPIYTIRAVEPGKTIGSSLWSFAYVDGAFRYLGKLKPVKPDSSPLDELSVKAVGEALKGE